MPVVDARLVRTAAHGADRPGRRGAPVTGSFIGVDVGGTKVAASLLRGTTLSEAVVQPTKLESADALIEQFVSLVAEVRG